MNTWPDESHPLPNISLLEQQIRNFRPSDYILVQKGYCSPTEYSTEYYDMHSKHRQKIHTIIEASLPAHISHHMFRDFQETTQRVKEFVDKHNGIYFEEGGRTQKRFYGLSSPIAPDFLGELAYDDGKSMNRGIPAVRTATLNLLLSPRLAEELNDSLLPALGHISSISFPDEKTQFLDYGNQILPKITDYKRGA